MLTQRWWADRTRCPARNLNISVLMWMGMTPSNADLKAAYAETLNSSLRHVCGSRAGLAAAPVCSSSFVRASAVLTSPDSTTLDDSRTTVTV